MIQQTSIRTERLLLRAFSPSDAKRVMELAGAKEIYQTTEAVPHPYEKGMAEAWIASHPQDLEKGTGVTFAIERVEDSALVGAIGLVIDRKHKKANLGYWIGVPYWRKGYCTEAAKGVIRFG